MIPQHRIHTLHNPLTLSMMPHQQRRERFKAAVVTLKIRCL